MKKRMLAVLLGTCMALSIVACGKDKGTSDQNVNGESDEIQVEEHNIGETVVDDNYEITILDVCYGTNLCTSASSDDYLFLDGNYDEKIQGVNGEKYDKAYIAADDRAYVVIKYNLKFTGKSQLAYSQYMTLDYDNGYEFGDHPYVGSDFSYKSGDQFTSASYITLEPLCEDKEIRSVFDVPKQVMDDKDKPLILKFNISVDGTIKEVHYKLR